MTYKKCFLLKCSGSSEGALEEELYQTGLHIMKNKRFSKVIGVPINESKTVGSFKRKTNGFHDSLVVKFVQQNNGNSWKQIIVRVNLLCRFVLIGGPAHLHNSIGPEPDCTRSAISLVLPTSSLPPRRCRLPWAGFGVVVPGWPALRGRCHQRPLRWYAMVRPALPVSLLMF